MADLRSAVQHLHKLGFCHNDINSSNIMFDEQDEVVLIDFDSCAAEGEKLMKQFSSKQNDVEALKKVADFMQHSEGTASGMIPLCQPHPQ